MNKELQRFHRVVSGFVESTIRGNARLAMHDWDSATKATNLCDCPQCRRRGDITHYRRVAQSWLDMEEGCPTSKDDAHPERSYPIVRLGVKNGETKS